jgi:hypothetical protein
MVRRIRTVRILVTSVSLMETTMPQTTQNKLMTHHHHHYHLMHEMERMVRTVAMMKNKMMAVVVMWKL